MSEELRKGFVIQANSEVVPSIDLPRGEPFGHQPQANPYVIGPSVPVVPPPSNDNPPPPPPREPSTGE